MKNEQELKKFRCWKCGHELLTYEKPIICAQPMAFRTSGICAGSYKQIDKFNSLTINNKE